jgi:colanic acid/amylovoran biosynthesis glycosyltransferase
VAQPGTVLVWRHIWLAPSETFIANQVASLTRWQPVLVGREALPNGLMQPDGTVKRVSGIAAQAARLNSISAQVRPRLIHAHFGPDAIEVLPLARRLNVPLIVTFHGFDATERGFLRNPSKILYRLRLPQLFRYVAKVIAVSDFIGSKLAELGAPANRTVICPIGIPDRPRHGQYHADGPITFVGRFVDKKGVSDLLAAVAALPAPYRDRRIDLIGYGPLEEGLREQASRDRLNVVFVGKLSPDGVAEALSRSAVFCAPSKTAPNGDAEGFGMVFLEAAQQGVPVVSYRHGGIPEAVEDKTTGLLADEGDVGQLSAHLQTMLADPVYAQRLGAAGRRRVESDFLISGRTKHLERLYDEVAGQPAGELQ